MSPDFSEFLENIGIKMRINKIGKYKDMNSPFRSMTDEENKIYTGIMNDIYLAFRDEVKKRRNFTDEKLETIATGLVFSAEQAKENGLIDGIGNIDNVLDQLKEKTLADPVKNLTPKRPFLSRIMSMSMEAFTNIIDNIR